MLSKSYLFKILFFIIFTLIDINLNAKCRLSLSSVKPVVFEWDGESKIVRNSLVVTRSASGKNKCQEFNITMDRGHSSTYRPRYMTNRSSRLSYNLYSKRNAKRIIYHHPFAFLKSRVISSKFKKYEISKTIYYWAKVDKASRLNKLISGAYFDRVVVRVYRGKLPLLTKTVHDSSVLIVTTHLFPNIELSLVSTGGPFDSHDTYESLNYGNLQEGESRGFDIRVKSNTPYKIMFSSANDGHLQESTRAQRINYYLKVKGKIQNLRGSGHNPVEVARGLETSSGSGVFPIHIQIGKVKNKLSGLYQDTIQVEVMSI